MARLLQQQSTVKYMTSPRLALAATSALALQLTGCEAVKFVFKTGFWLGVTVVVAIVLVIAFVVRRAS
jgi:hypothetical protein